jgi:guanylate kinase
VPAAADPSGGGEVTARTDQPAGLPEGARVVVLTGPSGVGKSTVVRTLRREHPDLWLSVSVTTRHPRPGERDGREYHFVDHPTFDRLVAEGDLLEWAEFAGNRYGTPRTPVLERVAAGMPVLLEVDLQGARRVRREMPEAIQVFLAPPTWDELERRLVGRGTEPPDVIDRRLAAARVELAAESEFDVSIDNHDVTAVCARLLDLLGLHA